MMKSKIGLIGFASTSQTLLWMIFMIGGKPPFASIRPRHSVRAGASELERSGPLSAEGSVRD